MLAMAAARATKHNQTHKQQPEHTGLTAEAPLRMPHGCMSQPCLKARSCGQSVPEWQYYMTARQVNQPLLCWTTTTNAATADLQAQRTHLGWNHGTPIARSDLQHSKTCCVIITDTLWQPIKTAKNSHAYSYHIMPRSGQTCVKGQRLSQARQKHAFQAKRQQGYASSPSAPRLSRISCRLRAKRRHKVGF